MPPFTRAERELLSTCGLFRDLPAEDLDAVVERAVARAYPAEAVLFRQGEPVSGMFVLLGGCAKLSQLGVEGQEVIIRVVAPGEVFAALAALERVRAFPVTATALTPLRTAFWPRPEIQEIFRQRPALSSALLQAIADRTQDLQARFREVATERVPQRLAHLLLRLASRAGRPVDGGLLIDFPLTRQDLADMVGTTLYTVSRVLSEWGEAGILEVGRKRVVLRARTALERVAAESGG